MAEPGNHDRAAVDDLLAATHAPADLDRELTRVILRRAAETDPELAEAIRLCAIPRRFDAEILDVVRPGADGANAKAFATLALQSFVRPNPDGTLSYDDVTRTVLIDEWRAAEHREQLDEVIERLVLFYSERHDEVQVHERELRRIADVVRRASPARYVQLVGRTEASLLSPLLEALDLEALRSDEAVYDFFERYCFDYEGKGRVTVCQTLLHAAKQTIEGGLGAGRNIPGWLKYWEARLSRQLLGDARAEQIVTELLDDVGGDVKLETWALSELFLAQQGQSKLKEAMATCLRQVARAEETQADPYNLSRAYVRLGDAHSSLDELEQAEAAYRRGIELARENYDTATEAGALLSLAGVLSSAGSQDAALSTCLEAIWMARTGLRGDPSVQGSFALSSLLTASDPQLAETTFQEAEALGAELDDPLQGWGLRRTRLDLFRQAGQIDRALDLLGQLLGATPGHLDERTRSGLVLDEALLADAQGDVDRGLALYGTLLDRVRAGLGDHWHEGAGLINRANLNVKLGRWTEAEADYVAAEAKWRDLQHEIHANLVVVSRADLARLRGDLEDAKTLLEQARPYLDDARSSRSGDFQYIRGQVLESCADWTGAVDAYQRALTVYRAVGQIDDSAAVLTCLARVSRTRSRWGEATRYAGEASRLWQELADLNTHYPFPAVQDANAENGRGLRAFVQSEQDGRRLGLARDLFRSAAERVPANPLFRLNLAYAHIHLGQWQDAARAIEDALGNGIGTLPAAFFYDSLARCHRGHAVALGIAWQIDDAVEANAKVYDGLAGQVAPALASEALLAAGDLRLKQEGRAQDAAALFARAAELGIVMPSSLGLRQALVAAAEGERDLAAAGLRAAVELRTTEGDLDPKASLRQEADVVAYGSPLAGVLDELEASVFDA